MAIDGPQLPVGTQVVLRAARPDDAGGTAQRGATGRIDGATADGRYEVRLADGRSTTARRDQLSLRTAYQDEAIGVEAPDGDRLVRERTIYAAVVGSRAFGLDTDTSDTDTRGVYVAPTEAFWSLAKPPTHVEGPEPEWFSREVERFCELALKANPNLLEVLHSPLVVTRTPLGDELLELRPAFLSQLAYQTYSGYVLSQFKKLEADFRRDGAPKWKHVMHLIRLLLSARTLLAEGVLVVDVGPHRDRLLAVKAGALPWDEVERWRLDLHEQLDDALRTSVLPPTPEVGKVDAWLGSVRRRSIAEA
ncbi:nucleotidyltransferase-like protein [Kribbella flavida DSM 17836]|uniref:Nucleotidyltransferase-like protein n=1 Tax=Kribbella flavida (strain DSM 17836 / JCM 10339 / NBRC 14399) TaxID=479435 RepID=D2PNJ1_KRIFD|nr:nucleotidyltransferase domain-containing protein [Kribbella flavida]ADB30843.1 nucleotidyltransferase-like protein [Kribbella flavida DSM 17836]